MVARNQKVALLPKLLALAMLGGCGNVPAASDIGAGGNEPIYPETLPYARSVESFTPGAGAGVL